jgi:hypothetical protein
MNLSGFQVDYLNFYRLALIFINSTDFLCIGHDFLVVAHDFYSLVLISMVLSGFLGLPVIFMNSSGFLFIGYYFYEFP